MVCTKPVYSGHGAPPMSILPGRSAGQRKFWGCLQILRRRGESRSAEIIQQMLTSSTKQAVTAIGEVDSDAECMSIGPPIWPHLSLGAE